MKKAKPFGPETDVFDGIKDNIQGSNALLKFLFSGSYQF